MGHLYAQRHRRARGVRDHRRGVDAVHRGAPAPRRAGRRAPPGRGHGRRLHRLQRHPARLRDDRAGHRRRRRRDPLGDAVLQQAEPAGHARALRRGRPGHRQARRALQHPLAVRGRPAQRPARRARPDRADRLRQAGQQRQPRARSTAWGSTPATTTCSARCSRWAAAAGSSSRATSSGPPCAAWSTSPTSAPRSRPRSSPLFDALGVTTNPIPVKAALDLLGRPVGGLRLPMVEADEHEREVVRAALVGAGLL